MKIKIHNYLADRSMESVFEIDSNLPNGTVWCFRSAKWVFISHSKFGYPHLKYSYDTNEFELCWNDERYKKHIRQFKGA